MRLYQQEVERKLKKNKKMANILYVKNGKSSNSVLKNQKAKPMNAQKIEP